MFYSKVSKILLAIAGILILAVALRIWKIGQKGFFQYDEAYYLLEAKIFPASIQWITTNWPDLKVGRNNFSDLKNYVKETGCLFPLGTAKPVYLLILSVWTTIIGLIFGVQDYTSFLLSALLGTAGLLLVFLISRKVWDEKTALFSAILVFLSVNNLFYSRSGFPQSTAVFFLLLSIYSVFKERYFLSGVLLACALGAHYCMLFNVFVFSVWMLIFHRNKIVIFLTGLILPLLMVEGFYRLGKMMLLPWLDDVTFFTYFQHILRQFSMVSPLQSGSFLSSFLEHDWMTVFRIIWTEGPFLFFISLLFFVLPFLRWEKNSNQEWFVWLNGWGVLLVWILNSGQVISRAIFPAWTIALLGSGVVVSLIKPRSLRILFLLAATVFSVVRFYKIVNIKCGYRDAVQWMKNHGQNQVIDIYTWPIYQFYFNKKIYANHDGVLNMNDLQYFYEKGIIFFTADYFLAHSENDKNLDFPYSVLDFQKPVAQFPLRFTDFSWLENHFTVNREEQWKFHNSLPEAKNVRIYDLRQYFSSEKIKRK